MYAALIFAALISSSASAVTSLSEGREFSPSKGYGFQVVDDAQLHKVVNGAVAFIDRIARAPWKPEQKLRAIQQACEKVQAYRARSWSRSPATEHRLDLLIGPYESFPSASEFRRNNCKNYYSTLKVDWEPTASGTPKLPGVKRAWNNLKAICE